MPWDFPRIPMPFPMGLPMGFPMGVPMGFPSGIPMGIPISIPMGIAKRISIISIVKIYKLLKYHFNNNLLEKINFNSNFSMKNFPSVQVENLSSPTLKFHFSTYPQAIPAPI